MKKNASIYFGIDDSDETKKKAIMSYIGMKGKIYPGYSDDVLMRVTENNIDFFLRANRTENGTKLNYIEPFYQAASLDVVDLTVINSNLDKNDSNNNYRKICAYNNNNGGYGVVNLINVDTLPSMVEGTKISAQIIAFPYGKFRKYVDNKAYKKSMEKNRERYYPNGSIYPIGYIDKYVFPLCEDIEDVDTTFIKGRVTRVKRCISKLFGKEEYTRAAVSTDWGTIHVIYTDDQLMYGENNPLTVGSIICGRFWIQGDVCIDDREKYSNRRSDVLALLQNTFELGNADRLRKVLSADVILESENASETFGGIDAVIKRFNYIKENCNRNVFAHLAEITWRYDYNKSDDERKKFGKGTQCVVLAYSDPRNHESIVFINRNNEGLVKKIKIINTAHDRFLYRLKSNPRRKGYE